MQVSPVSEHVGGGWHTDHSYDQIPARGSIPVARDLPDSGGETCFLSVGAASDALSAGLQRTLEGRKLLYANAAFPFSYEFEWAPGSIATWDNHSTWHWARNDSPGQRRLMHRITVAGDPLRGVEPVTT